MGAAGSEDAITYNGNSTITQARNRKSTINRESSLICSAFARKSVIGCTLDGTRKTMRTAIIASAAIFLSSSTCADDMVVNTGRLIAVRDSCGKIGYTLRPDLKRSLTQLERMIMSDAALMFKALEGAAAFSESAEVKVGAVSYRSFALPCAIMAGVMEKGALRAPKNPAAPTPSKGFPKLVARIAEGDSPKQIVFHGDRDFGDDAIVGEHDLAAPAPAPEGVRSRTKHLICSEAVGAASAILVADGVPIALNGTTKDLVYRAFIRTENGANVRIVADAAPFIDSAAAMRLIDEALKPCR
jgi:hypothetical protein